MDNPSPRSWLMTTRQTYGNVSRVRCAWFVEFWLSNDCCFVVSWYSEDSKNYYASHPYRWIKHAKSVRAPICPSNCSWRTSHMALHVREFLVKHSSDLTSTLFCYWESITYLKNSDLNRIITCINSYT